MGALSLVMLVWRGMSSTSSLRSTVCVAWNGQNSRRSPGSISPEYLPSVKTAIRSYCLMTFIYGIMLAPLWLFG